PHEDSLKQRQLEAELARERARHDAARERAAEELAMKRAAGELAAELVRLERTAHAALSEARLTEIALTETLPRVAEAFRGSFDRVNVTCTGDSDLFGLLSAGVDRVLTL